MGRHAFKVVTSVQKYGAIIPFVRPFSYSFNRKWDRQMCQGFMNTWRNQFHFIFHAAAYSQSVIETYLVNCLETDNNNNDNQTSVQGLLFCPVSTCVTLFSFSLLSQSHHIPSTYSATVPHPSYTCCLVKSTRRMNISYIGVFCSFIWKYPCTLYFYLKVSFVTIFVLLSKNTLCHHFFVLLSENILCRHLLYFHLKIPFCHNPSLSQTSFNNCHQRFHLQTESFNSFVNSTLTPVFMHLWNVIVYLCNCNCVFA